MPRLCFPSHLKGSFAFEASCFRFGPRRNYLMLGRFCTAQRVLRWNTSRPTPSTSSPQFIEPAPVSSLIRLRSWITNCITGLWLSVFQAIRFICLTQADFHVRTCREAPFRRAALPDWLAALASPALACSCSFSSRPHMLRRLRATLRIYTPARTRRPFCFSPISSIGPPH